MPCSLIAHVLEHPPPCLSHAYGLVAVPLLLPLFHCIHTEVPSMHTQFCQSTTTLRRQSCHQHLRCLTLSSPQCLQVWQRSIPAAAAALLPPLYQAGPARQEAGDVLLGGAGVDLGLLRVLPALEGWYNLADDAGGVRGQLKVGMAGLWRAGRACWN
jgi:hypothetical protein